MALSLKTDAQVLGLPIKFMKASEPTDIIWENRIYTRWDYFFRQLVAFVIIGILLFGSFCMIYYVARMSAGIAREFPKVDCEAIR